MDHFLKNASPSDQFIQENRDTGINSLAEGLGTFIEGL